MMQVYECAHSQSLKLDCGAPSRNHFTMSTAPVITNVAAYQFTSLTGLKEWRLELLRQCREDGLKGTILLSTEGINLFVAGAREAIDRLLASLRKQPGLESLTAKFSVSSHQPFTRMLVRIKKEIIAFGVEGIDPARHTAPKLQPSELKRWLDEGRPVTLIDTRNDYEAKLGTFRNALTLGLDHFRNFPAAVRLLPEALKEQPIVTFCTGGIRCEKAGAYMEREGFRHVYQLDGGILKYFEDCGSAHYEGECFVFDHRVGLDPTLHETSSAVCFACQAPLTEEDQRSQMYVPGKSCPACWRPREAIAAEALKKHQEALRHVTSPLPGSIPYDNYRPLRIFAECDGLTLREALAITLPHRTMDSWEAMITAGQLRDDKGHAVTWHDRVAGGQRLIQLVPGMVEPTVNADIKLLYEDEAILVLNKPAPLPMHAGGRFSRNTLSYFLQLAYHPQKPRPAHRLDANTTGVVVVCRTRHFASQIQPQFQRGEVEKVYLARVAGHPTWDAMTCDAPIGAQVGPHGSRSIDEGAGLSCTTDFKVLQRLPDGTTLLEARPRTGRTNQIRLHLAHLRFPVEGDPLYLADGALGTVPTLAVDDPPLCLHAWRIRFRHPLKGERMTFTAQPPSWAKIEDIPGFLEAANSH